MNEIDMHNTKVHYEKTVSDGDISCVAEFWMATLRRYNEMMEEKVLILLLPKLWAVLLLRMP